MLREILWIPIFAAMTLSSISQVGHTCFLLLIPIFQKTPSGQNMIITYLLLLLSTRIAIRCKSKHHKLQVDQKGIPSRSLTYPLKMLCWTITFFLTWQNFSGAMFNFHGVTYSYSYEYEPLEVAIAKLPPWYIQGALWRGEASIGLEFQLHNLSSSQGKNRLPFSWGFAIANAHVKWKIVTHCYTNHKGHGWWLKKMVECELKGKHVHGTSTYL